MDVHGEAKLANVNTSKQQDIILSGAQVFLEKEVLSSACVDIKNGKIAKIDKKQKLFDKNSQVISLAPEHKILPGYIDLHIHGTHGVDVMDATPEALTIMMRSLPEEGTTSFLATTVTMAADKTEAALLNIASVMNSNSDDNIGAQILGVHLEGPFIAPQKAGSHIVNNIIKPDINLFKHWQAISENNIKLVTVAPEIENSLEFIKYLTSQNITASIGHTNADYQQAKSGISAGCQHATHLFNAMSGLDHRNPGAALAVLEEPILAELIADGIHVSPEMLNFAFNLKGKERLCLVTDSMRAKCMGDGEFELGGQKVIVKNNQARLGNGTLAGSILKMSDASQNMLRFNICDLFELMYMTAINPAKQLGVFDSKGSIDVGKDADLIVLDKNNKLCMTLCNGKICYQSAS